jgi:hypothetical protein
VWIHHESWLESSHVPRSLGHVAVQLLPAHHLPCILSHVGHQSSWLPVHPLHVALMLWLPPNHLRKPDPAPAPRLLATVPSFLHYLPNTLHPLYPTKSFDTKFKRRKTICTLNQRVGLSFLNNTLICPPRSLSLLFLPITSLPSRNRIGSMQ